MLNVIFHLQKFQIFYKNPKSQEELETYMNKTKTRKPGDAGPKFQSHYPHINFKNFLSISMNFNIFPVISIMV